MHVHAHVLIMMHLQNPNCKVAHLELRHNHMGPESAKSIAAALKV